MNERVDREVVRQLYRQRCGYCGVHETEAGSELEGDHFQPKSAGGSDHLDNLVYCCSTCNRLKGNFWPPDGMAANRRLLHPRRDDLAHHLRVSDDGRLVPRTDLGAFHCARLRLNRAPLVALRQTRAAVQATQQRLSVLLEEQASLRERIAELESALDVVREQLARLLDAERSS